MVILSLQKHKRKSRQLLFSKGLKELSWGEGKSLRGGMMAWINIDMLETLISLGSSLAVGQFEAPYTYKRSFHDHMARYFPSEGARADTVQIKKEHAAYTEVGLIGITSRANKEGEGNKLSFHYKERENPGSPDYAPPRKITIIMPPKSEVRSVSNEEAELDLTIKNITFYDPAGG